MIGVDMIGEIRRAYFEQRRAIKEIVRTLRVSRATVRKVIRGHRTEFKYEREVQPTPKLGDWVEVLTEVLEKEAKLPRESAARPGACSSNCAGADTTGAHDSVHRFVKACPCLNRGRDNCSGRFNLVVMTRQYVSSDSSLDSRARNPLLP